MEIKKNIILLFIIEILIIGCNMHDNSQDSNSEIKKCVDSLSFFKNGQLIFKGRYCNNKREGDFIEYYPDGTIKWKGSYSNDNRKYKRDFLPLECKINVVDIPTSVEGNKYLKVSIQGVHPDDFYILTHKLKKINYSDNPNFDYIITPNGIDSVDVLNIYFFRNTEKVFICDYKLNLK